MDVELSNTIGLDSISACFLPGSSFQDFNSARAWHQKTKPCVAGVVNLTETTTTQASHKCSFSPRESQAMFGPSIPPSQEISGADPKLMGHPHPLHSPLQRWV